MKILYGIQATGNGHITRARSMVPHLRSHGIEVDCLFSGRERDKFFDMELFGEWRCHKGLTFYHKAGKLSTLQTIQKNSMKQLLNDIKTLDLSPYDLILTDFEPVVAHAARRQKKCIVGVGHQYAFSNTQPGAVPRRGDNWLTDNIMKYFAPVDIGLGLHWYHFGQAILPPIAEVHTHTGETDTKKIVVYLGFEEPADVVAMLEPFDDYNFVYYTPTPTRQKCGHIEIKPLSREGFQKDLAECAGVICNAGFELASEAIQLGKKLLQKPLQGQMEQLSNAKALETLGLGMAMDTLDKGVVRRWLNTAKAHKVSYPDVAADIAKWISEGDWTDVNKRNDMIVKLWQNTIADGVLGFQKKPLPEL